jgi:hypothetical protein
MKRTVLILVCVLIIIQGITDIVRQINPNLLNIIHIHESTAFYIGKITAFLFKIVIGAGGLIILIRKSKQRVSI